MTAPYKKNFKLPKGYTMEAYLSDILELADSYFDGFEVLQNYLFKERKFNLFEPASFLATHSAELYIKALIIHYTGSDLISKSKGHNLIKLLKLLSKYDPKSSFLDEPIRALEKYSGIKMRYVEYNQAGVLYGSDEISQVRVVKSYVKEKLSN